MKITCTFDDTTHKVVPIVANELMLNYGYYYTESALPVYSDMVKAAPPYPADTGWIPVSERLPGREGFFDVFIGSSGASIYNGRQADVLYCFSRWQVALQDGQYISHWMPIPAAPKGG